MVYLMYGLFGLEWCQDGYFQHRHRNVSSQLSPSAGKKKKKERSFTAFVVEKSVEPELADPTF